MTKVTRSGLGIEALQKNIRTIGTKAAEVGFFENAHYPDGKPVAYIATIQEFGSGAIPPRSFMRSTANEQRQAWEQKLAQGARKVLAGDMRAEQMLDAIGQMAAGDIKQTITSLTSPPLKPSTIASRLGRKNKPKNTSAKPLVDSGVLLSSVESKVVAS